jgi:acyl-CoA thioester hydrolase
MRHKGLLPVTVHAKVAFHDVDFAGITWHGHYLKYLENARWALFDRIGYSLDDMTAAAESWPVIDLKVRYVRAARFGDVLAVEASLIDWQSRLVINYRVTDAATGEPVTRAQTTQVVVAMPGNKLRFDLPSRFIDLVESALRATTAGAQP